MTDNGAGVGVKVGLDVQLGNLTTEVKKLTDTSTRAHKLFSNLARQTPFSVKDDGQKTGASLAYSFLSLHVPQPGFVYQLRRLVVYPADPFTSSSVLYVAFLGNSSMGTDGATEPPFFPALLVGATAVGTGSSSTWGRGEVTLKQSEVVMVCWKTLGTAVMNVSAEYEVWREDDFRSEVAP